MCGNSECGNSKKSLGILSVDYSRWSCLVLVVVSVLSGQCLGEVYDDSCHFALTSQVTQVDTYTLDIAEVHIRQNIQGSLEIRDGDLDDTKLRIHVEKSAPSDEEIKLILVNQSTFHVQAGSIHVIQIDYIEEKGRMVNAVVGSVVTCCLLLLVVGLIGCWFWRRRNEDFSLEETALYSQPTTPGLERNITRDTVVPEEEESSGQGQTNKHCGRSGGTIRRNGQLQLQSCDLRGSHDTASCDQTCESCDHHDSAECACGSENCGYAKLENTEEAELQPIQTSSPKNDPPAAFPTCCYDNSVISPSSTLTDTGFHSGTNLNRISLASSNNNSYELLDRRNAQQQQGGGGGVQPNNNRGSPRPLSRTTVAMFTLVTMVSLVYASCPTQPGVKLILLIPPTVKLGSLKVFYNKEHSNKVTTDTWMLRNFTNFQVFDLLDASLSKEAPCSPPVVCPSATPTHLLGCDTVTKECVCHRGYQLTDMACTDVDECTSGSHTCPASASCVNTLGGYLCQCARGHYATDSQCKVCSAGCEKDHYEAKPCTNVRDRICKPCQKCEKSMYEVGPCTPTSDRECIHAAHPLLISGDDSTPTFLEGQKYTRTYKGYWQLRVDASDNLVLEDLHNMRDLETIFYVTDTTQASDFEWVRDSGLVVKIGILNVHLIPEYEDADHESDNKYILADPNESQDKMKFREVMDKKCRNPIPDYYSITMEISRDRTTKAEMVTCDNRDPSLHDCPVGKVDGSTYLDRTLNAPCTNMGTFPKDLQIHPNSIVCTENTDLLREVFNRSYTEERPISFPSRKCKNAQMRCDQCISHLECGIKEVFESKCCLVGCYTLADCKYSQSPECTEAPVECAMGDAYRYTIQPVFQKIKEEFHCHLEHKPPKVLYDLFFHLEMPGKEYITPKVDRTVFAKDLNYMSQGEFQADYLTVEHNAGILLDQEFMLVGRDENARQSSEEDVETEPPRGEKMNYTLHRMKTEEDFHNKRVSVHEIDHNIYVATTVFSRPFDYSTSSWVRNNECHKDISKFQFYDREAAYTKPQQQVNVRIQPGQDKYKYWVQGERSPYIRFTVPGNMSILPWYFKDNGPELLTDSTLNLSLQLLGDKVWNIHISGEMTNCPAYLGVTINDRENKEELIKHDILVTCPTSFNLTFHIPNFNQPHDKTFDIHLKDAKKLYQTFLTQLKLDSGSEIMGPEPVVLTEAEAVPYLSFLIILAITLFAVAVFNKAYLYSEIMRQKNRGQFIAKQQQQQQRQQFSTGTGGGLMTQRRPASHSATCGRSLTTGQVVFLVTYIVLRVIYSLLFTFTVFFALLMFFMKTDLENLSRVDNFVQEAKNQSIQMARDNDRHWRVELLRQAEQVKDMQGACSNYVTELFDSMAFQMNNITSNYYTHELYGTNASLSYYMHQRSKVKLQALSEDIDKFTEKYKERVTQEITPALHKYRNFLKVVFSNDWLSFSQLMYNSSETWRVENDVYLARDRLLLSGVETEFLRFLEIQEVDELRLWMLKFWERYESLLPDLPELPIPEIVPSNLFCERRSSHGNYNITRQPSMGQMDSVQYFSPKLPADVDKGPVYHNGEHSEEYRFVTERPIVTPQIHPLADEELDITNMVNTRLLSMIFLILDAILLLYRFSHTFINASAIIKGFDIEASREEWESVGEYYTSTMTTPLNSDRIPHAGHHQHTKYKHTPDHSHVPLGDQTYDPNYQLHAGKVMAPSPKTIKNYNGSNGDTLVSHQTKAIAACERNYTSSGERGNRGGLLNSGHHYHHQGRTNLCEAVVGNVKKLILSNTLPQVLVGCCILVLVYVLTLAIVQVADMKFILDTNLLGLYTSGMHIQINQTNWYLSQQADYFNSVSMGIYGGQMTSELKYLQSMLHYFDNEQERLVENYQHEGCSITRQPASNWSCDIQVEPPTLNLPLLPCNFVPVLPRLLSDLLPVTLEQSLVQSLDPYMLSVRRVSHLVTYAIFISLCAILVIHVCGVVVFNFLKSSHRFTIRRVFTTTSDLPPRQPLATGGGGAEEDEEDAFPPPPPTEESDYESEAEDGQKVWSYSLPRQNRQEVNKPKADGTGTLKNDFKYSETKV